MTPSRDIDLAGHAGILQKPRGARALYLFAHGAGAGMRHPFMTAMSDALARRNVATLRWEFPFMTAGKGAPDTAEVAEASARAVWGAATNKLGALPRFAGGKSFGGRMTSRAHAAEPLDDLQGLIFLGFPLHPADKPGPKVERAGFTPARGPKVEGAGFTPARGIERAEHLALAKGPMLFVQGARDELAELKLLKPVVKKLGARATLHVVEAADHGFEVLKGSGRTGEQVIEELATTIAEWITRTLDS